MLNPIGLINDGYMELIYMNHPFVSAARALQLFKGAKSGGT